MPKRRLEKRQGQLTSQAVRHLRRLWPTNWPGSSAAATDLTVDRFRLKAESPHLVGPVFLCHRDSDGADLTREVAWVLRAHGVPVWVDEDDFPPGDTDKRMEEALTAGLSGAVIVVTPEIEKSKAVQGIELRRILELEETNPNFTLAIANSIQDPTDPLKPDYGAPDRLLREPTSERLAKITQYLTLLDAPETLERLASDIIRQQLRVRPLADDVTLIVDIESRQRGSARVAGEAHIISRLEGPDTGRRALPARSWRRLRPILTLLPDLAAEYQANNVLIRGGAHLSVGFAIGASLPITAPVQVRVEARNGDLWGVNSGAPAPFNDDAQSTGRNGGPVAVYVNMTTRPEGGGAFDHFLADAGERFSGSLRLTATSPIEIAGDDGAATARSLVERTVEFAAEHQTQEIHLFLRVPFPLAVLLGRQFNTFTIHLYEWEDGVPSTYQSAAVVASGRGGGPVVDITAG